MTAPDLAAPMVGAITLAATVLLVRTKTFRNTETWTVLATIRPSSLCTSLYALIQITVLTTTAWNAWAWSRWSWVAIIADAPLSWASLTRATIAVPVAVAILPWLLLLWERDHVRVGDHDTPVAILRRSGLYALGAAMFGLPVCAAIAIGCTMEPAAAFAWGRHCRQLLPAPTAPLLSFQRQNEIVAAQRNASYASAAVLTLVCWGLLILLAVVAITTAQA